MKTKSPFPTRKPTRPRTPHPPPAPKKKLHPLIERYKKPALIVGGNHRAHRRPLLRLRRLHARGNRRRLRHRPSARYLAAHQRRRHRRSGRRQPVRPSRATCWSSSTRRNTSRSPRRPRPTSTRRSRTSNRMQPLVATHAIAPEDVDKATSTRDVDLAQYELAKLQIDYSTITAPADGYIGPEKCRGRQPRLLRADAHGRGRAGPVGRGQFQGNAARAHEDRPARANHHRLDSRTRFSSARSTASRRPRATSSRFCPPIIPPATSPRSSSACR